MLKKMVIILLGALVLAGCAENFRGYFKKSANNRLIDTKGFDGEKRKPLYNKKYISLAKRNVIEENYDDDDGDYDDSEDPLFEEKIHPAVRNRAMYLKMIKGDLERQKQKQSKDKGGYGSLIAADKKVKEQRSTGESDAASVRRELDRIKLMLEDTQKELGKYNCPNSAPAPSAPERSALDISPTKDSGAKPVRSKFLREDVDSSNARESTCAI